MKNNKKFKVLILFIFIFFAVTQNVYAVDIDIPEICKQENVITALKIVYYCIKMIQTFVPAILIIVGVKSLMMVVIDQDDKAMRPAVMGFITKLIIGACIFFVPIIITAILNMIENYATTMEQDSCYKCVLDINECYVR